MHHQAFDVARRCDQPREGTQEDARRIGRSQNDFVSGEAFDAMLLAWFGNAARAAAGPVVLHLGWVREPRQLPRSVEGLRAVFQPEHRVGQAASGAHAQDMMGCFEIAYYGWRGCWA